MGWRLGPPGSRPSPSANRERGGDPWATPCAPNGEKKKRKTRRKKKKSEVIGTTVDLRDHPTARSCGSAAFSLQAEPESPLGLT